MEKFSKGKHEIIIYSGIDDISIERYNLFNLYLLLESAVGSSIHDVNEKFAKLDTYLAQGMIEEAQIERRNLQTTFFSIYKKDNFTQKSFACLVHSIDGVIRDDISEEGLEATLKQLAKLHFTQGEVKSWSVKKKNWIIQNLKAFFPERFASSDLQGKILTKNLLLNKARLLARVSEENQENYNAALVEYLKHNRPKLMDSGKNSYLLELERNFIKMEAVLLEQGIQSPEKLPIRQFYALLDRFDQKAKQNKDALSKVKNGRPAKIKTMRRR